MNFCMLCMHFLVVVFSLPFFRCVAHISADERERASERVIKGVAYELIGRVSMLFCIPLFRLLLHPHPRIAPSAAYQLERAKRDQKKKIEKKMDCHVLVISAFA